jgi:beta-N-acetylhexosaminidase
MPLTSLPLSTEEKIGQMFFIGLPGAELDATTGDLLRSIQPGGICLFARNIRSLEAVHDLLDQIRTALPVEPFLSIDQEGGLVDRLRRVLGPMPAAGKIKTVEDARELGSIVAEALSRLGFNMDFAPVVDVATPDRQGFQNGLTSRTFGNSKEEVVELASAFIDELRSREILNCLKHFPGIGASRVDSHEELPEVNISNEELKDVDLFPYRSMLSTADAVMIAHAAYPNSDLQETDSSGKLVPASLSRSFVDGLLRDELDYQGLVITDDLEMGAIIKNFGVGDACVRAIEAGNDMLAICNEPSMIECGYMAVTDAVYSGRLSAERIDTSWHRIAALKGRLQAQTRNMDVAALQVLAARLKDFYARVTG